MDPLYRAQQTLSPSRSAQHSFIIDIMLARRVVIAAAFAVVACSDDEGGSTPADGGSSGGGGSSNDGGIVADAAGDATTGGAAGATGSGGTGGAAGNGGRGGASGGGTGGAAWSGGIGTTDGGGARGGSSGASGSAGSGGASGSAGSGGTGGAADAGDGGTVGLGCDPLPPPTGTVINVTPAQTAQLASIIAGASAGTTILLADGNYAPLPRLNLMTPGVSLRSASGNASAVVLDGNYATDEIIFIGASNVTVAEITVTRAINHPIHVSPPDAGPNVTGVRLYRLRLVDGGEQFVKVNPNGARTFWVDEGRLECSTLLLTDAGRPHVVSLPGLPCYTGGIDAHAARGWVVRRNRFEGFWCTTGLSEHAIHFWSASRDTLSEHNVIVNCAMGIGYGLGEMGTARVYADNPYPGVAYVGHYDGIIRNNVIYAHIAGFDTGVALEQARGVRVLHNTIVSTDTVTAFFSSIDYRFANTVAEIRNNLVRRISVRSGATGTVDHNLENVPLAYFVDVAAQDFHLVASAVNAIDKGVVVPEAGLDMDNVAHGAAPDLGAYERP
jgi:hypothetical protein